MPVDELSRARSQRSEVLFDERAQQQRLSEIYAPVFTLILQLRASDAYGDPDVLRRRIKDLLDQSEREARRAGYHSEELDQCKFALVAFIDETILSSGWHDKARWVAKSLQLELFERHDAGEVFFDRLHRLLEQPASQAEVLEVYYLCMALGFKGRYQLHDQERLRILIEDAYKALSRIPGMGSSVLAPHGKARDQLAAEVRSGLPVWVIAAFALVIALIIYIGMSLYLSSKADRSARAIDEIPRTEVTP